MPKVRLEAGTKFRLQAVGYPVGLLFSYQDREETVVFNHNREEAVVFNHNREEGGIPHKLQEEGGIPHKEREERMVL
jgi:hypothetical protein